MKPTTLQNLLRDTLRDNPKACEREVSDACWEAAKGNQGIVRALFQYWFKNSYRDFAVISFSQHSVAVMPAAGRARPAAKAPSGRSVAEAVARMETRLMDHILSDGTLLRNATFGQCGREAGWLQSIAKAGKANEIVGKKLTERDLTNLRMRANLQKVA